VTSQAQRALPRHRTPFDLHGILPTDLRKQAFELAAQPHARLPAKDMLTAPYQQPLEPRVQQLDLIDRDAIRDEFKSCDHPRPPFAHEPTHPH
jgi:hypothetical protein